MGRHLPAYDRGNIVRFANSTGMVDAQKLIRFTIFDQMSRVNIEVICEKNRNVNTEVGKLYAKRDTVSRLLTLCEMVRGVCLPRKITTFRNTNQDLSSMQDFEKLGVFYLGKETSIGDHKSDEELLLYDSKDLTTHAVVVGMTGSGKTGLCLDLLEEAGMDRVPAIVIDPKGDISNLLLTFPGLSAEEFEPWVDPGQASRKGMEVGEFAAAEAKKWKEGLESWGQTGERIKQFRENVDLRVYTPGSTAGRPVTVLKSFSAPPPEVLRDADAFRERIQAATSGLLALMGIDADPIRSSEHILISKIFETHWEAGESLDLGKLISEIMDLSLIHI